MKVIAIFGGGDWYDASVDHLVLPEGMNLQEELKKHKEWVRNEYRSGKAPYKDFFTHLKEKGARDPNEDELEIIYED